MARKAALVRRLMWVVPVVLGVVFLAAGGYMISQGVSAKNQVKSELIAEQITTSKDAPIPGVLVNSADTASAQEEAIKEHTLGKWGPYSKLAQTDPNRATYLNGVTLRTALNLAVMGFKISDLVIGVGAFIVALGAMNIFVLSPVLFWLRKPATEEAREEVRKLALSPIRQPS